MGGEWKTIFLVQSFDMPDYFYTPSRIRIRIHAPHVHPARVANRGHSLTHSHPSLAGGATRATPRPRTT